MKKTPLHQSHLDLGAKMGEFAGYDMPLYYDEGVMKEHEWVRSHAGLFDVSHMGQLILEGPDVAKFLERITPSAFQPKKNGRAQYTVLTNEQGGMVDDLIITRLAEDRFFVVVNAGRKDEDIEWISDNLPDEMVMEYWPDHALLALQGPSSEKALREVLEIDTADLPYMHIMEAQMPCGTDVFVSRLGYTGEDGFEISLPEEKAADVWTALLGHKDVKPIGLAARDSLRLEMGYPLYGHDIDETTSPVEAGLNWIISKQTEGYYGYERIQKELGEGTPRVRAGLKLLDKGVAREGAEIRNENDEKIGMLTSGGFSPTLKESIGQGYIDPAYAAEGTKLFVNVRGRNIAAEITKMPFVPAQTKSMKRKEAA